MVVDYAVWLDLWSPAFLLNTRASTSLQPLFTFAPLRHEKKQSIRQYLPLNRICLIPKSATQILLTSAVHPHPSSSPTLPPPIRSARSDPRHEDVEITSGLTLSSLTWPTIVRCHARHP
ncbi:hypothetical protein EDB86DRAFT_3103679, partial [Lactarius hatsudake]